MHYKLHISIFLVVVSLTISAQTPIQPAFLPPSDFLGQWKLDYLDKYLGEDLYVPINGGADLFLEYGFTELTIAEYNAKTDQQIRIYAYEMENDLAAIGIFSMQQKLKPTMDSLHLNIVAEKDYNALRINNFYFIIYGRNLKKEISLQHFAGFIIDSFGPKETEECLINTLLSNGQEYISVKYFSGPLAISNINRIADYEMYRFKNGVYFEQEEYQLFFLFHQNAQDAHSFFDALIDYVRGKSKYQQFNMITKQSFQYMDKKDVLFTVLYNNGIIIIQTSLNPELADDQIERITRNFRNCPGIF